MRKILIVLAILALVLSACSTQIEEPEPVEQPVEPILEPEPAADEVDLVAENDVELGELI